MNETTRTEDTTMTTTTTTKAPQTWTVTGFSEDGERETTRVSVYQNSEWTPELADDLFRYQVTRTLVEPGIVCDDDGFDNLREARDHAEELVASTTAEYRDREDYRRDDLYEALEELVKDTAEDSPEQQALEAIAGLIGRGKAGALLEALRAANLA